MSGFMNNRTHSLDMNTVSRFRNLLVRTLTDRVILPRLLVIVPDDDIINYPNVRDQGEVAYHRVLHWLLTQYSRIIQSWKEYLPTKAKAMGYPNIVWIKPPTHVHFDNNSERLEFGKSLSNVAQFQENVFVLKLKKVWDESDTTLFVKESN